MQIKFQTLAAAALMAAPFAAPTLAQTTEFAPITYPDAHRGTVKDIYHGVVVKDPYRWLEDAESAETAAWVEAQNEITFGYLEAIPERQMFVDRLTELWNYERYSTPSKEGGKYFYTRNDGLQPQSILYVADSLDAPGHVLLDPNTLSTDGTMALGGTSVSPDGRYLAYAVADGGSDWRTWYVRDIETGQDLPDTITWSKFSGAAWNADATGFYYTKFPEPVEGQELSAANTNSKIFYHEIGTDQAEDRMVFSLPDHPERGIYAATTEDGRYLLIYTRNGTDRRGGLAFADLLSEDGDTSFTTIVEPGVAQFSVLGNAGTKWYVSTSLDAPLSRVVTLDVAKADPTPADMVELVPESENNLSSASLVGDKLVTSYLVDAKSKIQMYNLDGSDAGQIELPGIGSAGGFGGELGDSETFYSFSSYTRPPTIFRLDVATGESTVFRQPEVAFNPDDYETRQVFYSSKDGTQVPMFISYKKGLQLDNNNPTLLYGYGGFSVSLTPSFSPANLAWMEQGGIYAVANLRGGGEYGKAWHDAGKLQNKQNVFDDFIAAGEYLVDYRYTRPGRLGIMGGSNGGLLVGAAMVQRPDLWGAALPIVGVMDMLRYDKFTIGYAWRSDYGWPEKNEADFRTNIAYSPYHNLKKGVCYPPTMVMTADRDDRVVPAHSFKFAAELQYAHDCDNPVLIRVETRAGHGAGKPTAKRIEDAADRYAFLASTIGIRPR